MNSYTIEVLGFSGDGDSKLLRAMKIKSELGGNSNDNELKGKSKLKKNQTLKENLPLNNNVNQKPSIEGFNAKLNPPQIFIQDTVHEGNKLKNLLLKDFTIIPIGKFMISLGHIKSVYKNSTKNKHFLNESDLYENDRMNFNCTMRLCHPRVWKLLKDLVAGSDGTQFYLKLIYYSTVSFLSIDLDFCVRVYLIWFALIAIRV